MNELENLDNPLQFAADLRAKVVAGEEVTPEEMAAALKALRQDRVSAKPQQGKKKKAEPVSLMNLEFKPAEEE